MKYGLMNAALKHRLSCPLACAAMLACAGTASAQFERTLGTDQPMEHFSVVTTQGDGFFSGGLRFNPGDNSNKIHLTRWGPAGEVIWERVVNAPNDSIVHSVFQTTQGDFLVAGETDSGGGPLGIFVMRVSPAGTLIWANRINGTPFLEPRQSVTVREILGNDILVTGREQVPGAALRAGRLARFNAGGLPIFNFRYNDTISPNTGQVSLNDFRQATDGTFWVIGERRDSANANNQMMLFHVAPNGAPIAALLYSLGQFNITGDAIDRFLPTGEMVLAGRRSNPVSGLIELRVVRTSPVGVPIWANVYSFPGGNWFVGHTAVAFRPQGDILCSGTFADGGDTFTALTLLGAGGNHVQSKLYGSPADTSSDDLALTSTIGAVMTGFYENGPFAFGARAVSLMVTDPAGNTTCDPKELVPVKSPLDFFFETQLAASPATQLKWDIQLVPIDSKRDFPCPPELPCYPDCDGNGILDINDFICFQTFYAISDPYADCDNNGILDINDFICYQTFYAIGC
jgi:hypothetical protein